MNKISNQNHDAGLNAVEIIELLTKGSQATAIYTSRALHIGFINNAMLDLWNKDEVSIGATLMEVAPEFKNFVPILEQVWDSGKAYIATDTMANILYDEKIIAAAFDFEYLPILDSGGVTVAIINTAIRVSERLGREIANQKKIRLEEEANVELRKLNAEVNLEKDELRYSNKEFLINNEALERTNEQLAALNEEYIASNEELSTTLEELALLNKQYNKSNLELESLNEELRLNRSQLADALRAASLGSFDLDLESGQMECSDQCKQNFGRPLHERFDYGDLKAAILPDFLDSFDRQVNDAIRHKSSFNIEYQVKWPDGANHWIQVNGTPQYDFDGQPVRIIGVTKVITDRKNYQARKDEFLSVASHELKTPITVLKANLQLLDKIKDKMESDVAVKLIDSCNRSMEKINVMLNELLDAGRYADGRIDLHLTSFDTDVFLRKALLHLKGDLKSMELDAESIKIVADENRLEQVVINFINNAEKYAAASEKIIVMVKRVGDSVRFSVQDFGPGIAAENIPRLFDRYWQANKEQDNSKGMGLGLYISSEIINKHQGKIGVDSTPGAGSTFWFEIPQRQ